MVKYHMSSRNGQPAMMPCHASVRSCPIGGPEGHREFANDHAAELYNTAMEFERDNNFKMGDLMNRAANGEPITDRDMEKALRKNRRFMRSNQDPNDPNYQQFLLENGDVQDIRQVMDSGRELNAQDIDGIANRFRNLPDSPEKGQLGLDLMDKTYAVDEFANARDYAFHEGVVNGNWKNVGQVFAGTMRNERDRYLMHKSREALADGMKGSLTDREIAEHQASMEQTMRERQKQHKGEISKEADRFRSPKSMWKRRMSDPSLTPEQRRDLDAAYMRIKDMDHSSVMELNRAMDTLYGQGVRPERTFATMKLLDRAVIRPARTARSTPANQRNSSETPATPIPQPRTARSMPRPVNAQGVPVPPAPAPAGGHRSTPMPRPVSPVPPAPPRRRYNNRSSYDSEQLRRAIPQAQGYVNDFEQERDRQASRLQEVQARHNENLEAMRKADEARRNYADEARKASSEERRLSHDLFGRSYNMQSSSEDTNRDRRRRMIAAIRHPVKYRQWKSATSRKIDNSQKYQEANSDFRDSYKTQEELKNEVTKASQAYESSNRRLSKAVKMLDHMQLGEPITVGHSETLGDIATYDTNQIMDLFKGLFK